MLTISSIVVDNDISLYMVEVSRETQQLHTQITATLAKLITYLLLGLNQTLLILQIVYMLQRILLEKSRKQKKEELKKL